MTASVVSLLKERCMLQNTLTFEEEELIVHKMKSELLFIAKMAVSFCQAFLATHGKSILDLPSTRPSDKFSFIIILMHKGCFDCRGWPHTPS